LADIDVTIDGPITRILLNRPQQMNAITTEMHSLLDEAFDAFAADDSQRIAVGNIIHVEAMQGLLSALI